MRRGRRDRGLERRWPPCRNARWSFDGAREPLSSRRSGRKEMPERGCAASPHFVANTPAGHGSSCTASDRWIRASPARRVLRVLIRSCDRADRRYQQAGRMSPTSRQGRRISAFVTETTTSCRSMSGRAPRRTRHAAIHRYVGLRAQSLMSACGGPCEREQSRLGHPSRRAQDLGGAMIRSPESACRSGWVTVMGFLSRFRGCR